MYNKNSIQYKDYGGRGITICDEWLNDFQAFYNWSMSNGYKDNLTIDRINVNGNYEPSNCRWATNEEQANNRRDNVKITYKGMTKTISEWAEYLGVNRKSFSSRVTRKWDIDRIFNQPYRGKHG